MTTIIAFLEFLSPLVPIIYVNPDYWWVTTNYLRGKNVMHASFSRDGKQIGILFDDVQRDDERNRIAILDSHGHVAKKFELPPGKLPWAGSRWIFRFSPDGQGVIIGMEWADVVNLWYQPISGGKPRQFTHSPDSLLVLFSMPRHPVKRNSPAILITDYQPSTF